MLPPLVPVCRRFGGIETLCPHWHMSGVLVAQSQDRSDMGLLQLAEDRSGIAPPCSRGRRDVPPVVRATRRIGHNPVPPRPVDRIGIALDRCDRWGAVDTIIVLPFPTRHTSIDAVGVDSQVSHVGDVKAGIAFYCTNITGAHSPLFAQDTNANCPDTANSLDTST